MAKDKYAIPDETPFQPAKPIPYKQERKTDFGIADTYRPAANVKRLTKNYTEGVLKSNGRYLKAEVNLINPSQNKFIVYNAVLDNKYTYVYPKDFEIYISGVKLSSDIYTVEQSGSHVQFTFTPGELDYDTFCADDIAIFGKFSQVDVNETTFYLMSENEYYITTEDNKLLIT